MLTLPLLSGLFSTVLSVGGAHALTLPITKRAPQSSPHSTSVRIAPGNNVSGNDPFGFQSDGGFAYTGIIYVSGQPFTVQLDTGSSDLWLDTSDYSLTNLTDTQVVGSIVYVDGTGAVGNINLGNVSWGEFTVPQQAFINAPGSNATNGGEFNGLLGVGPPSLSVVESTLQSANSQYDGSSFLDNVFGLYPDEPNFMTFLLSRNGLGTSDGGVFTIGDVEQNHTSIVNSTKLSIVAPSLWVTFMDGVQIDENLHYGGSLGSPLVPHIPVNQTLVVLDTGTSLSTAPPAYVDAMYAAIPGAQFDGAGNYYVPCDARINVTMIFGSDSYPMHPIDVTTPASISDDGQVLCQGAFSYAPDNAGVDFILGDSFLRNVYALYDFGSWAKVGDTAPFMQILSVTDLDQAYTEFDVLNQARIQAALAMYGPSATASSSATQDSAPTASRVLATAAASGTSSPISDNSNHDQDLSVAGNAAGNSGPTSDDIENLKHFSYIILSILAVLLILVIVLIVMVAKTMKSSGKSGKGYKALHDPNSIPPVHHVDVQPYADHKPYAGYSTPYAEGGH
ncbi:hypothetical protein EIP91_005886 [Steccherinum ochraceum]|uniref:Peptidase A1 domain-containing protein n=1 Tax=Steccherinum ochraceum TaxID=92696 RepID=A0A4R0RHE5_9APHY|nr:hypothetical protein EIP91_005886 [Steccherinum ochraceum]